MRHAKAAVSGITAHLFRRAPPPVMPDWEQYRRQPAVRVRNHDVRPAAGEPGWLSGSAADGFGLPMEVGLFGFAVCVPPESARLRSNIAISASDRVAAGVRPMICVIRWSAGVPTGARPTARRGGPPADRGRELGPLGPDLPPIRRVSGRCAPRMHELSGCRARETFRRQPKGPRNNGNPLQ